MNGQLTLCAVLVSACAPEFSEDAARIDAARVLAVKSEPAEAAPGAPLTLSALIAVPGAPAHGPMPSWSFCTAPKPVTEDNAVGSACLLAAELELVGVGATIQTAMPSEACSRFGPDTAPGGFRARDPDVTGGYYQPLRLDLAGAPPAFHLQRALCDLGDASADIATEFGMTYVPNQNPHLAPLVVRRDDRTIGLAEIPRGASVELQVSWAASDAESYRYFDRAQQSIVNKREAMRVSWHADAGQLETESSGVAEEDPTLSTRAGFRAPDVAGTVNLWVVLRDARGGADFAHYSFEILP